jgi:hypothetical protein
MRLLSLLLFFPFSFFQAQSDTITELASLHVIYDESTIAINLTESGQTDYFYFVNRRFAGQDRFVNYTPIDWLPQPNEKYTLQILEGLLSKGYKLLSMTSAMGNDIVGSETSISTIQELNNSYLLARRVAAISAVAKSDKKIQSQLKIEREDGQDWWLVIKEGLINFEGISLLERSLELEKHTGPGNFVVLSENRGAILPVATDRRAADPFKGMFLEESKLVLEHQLSGDTTYNIKHFFEDRDGRFFLERVEVIINYPGRDCARTDTVKYQPSKGNVYLETTYENCPNQEIVKGGNTAFYLIRRKKDLGLFDFNFGQQSFRYGRRRDQEIRY